MTLEPRPFLGRLHPLRLDRQPLPLFLDRRGFSLREDLLSQADPVFEDWYGDRLWVLLRRILPLWTHRLGVRPRSVSVKPLRSRWGSCGIHGDLSFSSSLARVAPDLVEYVAVHELAHLVHRNHRREFWDLVASCLPDLPERRARLRDPSFLPPRRERGR